MAKQASNMNADDERFVKEHRDGLSDTTTQQAKWIHSPDEGQDRPGQTLATRSHEVIRAWAEARGAKPRTVSGSEHDGHVGVLRMAFPDYGGDELEEIDWDAWFEPFDERELVFLYQQETSDGTQSNFFRLDNPRSEG